LIRLLNAPHILRCRLVVALAAAGLIALAVTNPSAGQEPISAFPCEAPAVTVEHSYTVAARIRPLLFWTTRRDVGSARLGWSQPSDGPRRLELLIGTDPNRTPMGINRWGYLAETVCGASAHVVGVMTESDEKTIEEAQVQIGQTAHGGHRFKAIRASVINGEANTEIIRLALAERLTYRDAGTILARLGTIGPTRQSRVPPGAESGFLVSLADLLQETVATYNRTGRVGSNIGRTYVYAGRLYVLTLRSATVLPELTLANRVYGEPINGEFEIRNHKTGERTRFSITYGTDPEVAGIPLRIIYRPRWWLELELRLNAVKAKANTTSPW